MNILETILSDKNGAIVNQIANQFGLDPAQAQSAIAKLVPAVAQGVKKNAATQQGFDSLTQALKKGNHQQYLSQPENLTSANAAVEGNAILGHVFGSKEVSREVANRAAQETNVSPDILKQMLPLLATTVMGSLGQKAQGGGTSGLVKGLIGQVLGGKKAGQSNDLMGMFGGMLDADNDGSYLDDIMGMVAKK